MADLIRWNPVREMVSMRNLMDRAFDDFFSRTPMTTDGYGIVDIDMAQTDDNVIIKASIPGVNPDDLNIAITGDTLTIRGEVKEDKEIEEGDYQIRERRIGSFARSVLLPSAVVADKAKAEFENGVLKLTLPKAEEVKPKTITVKAK